MVDTSSSKAETITLAKNIDLITLVKWNKAGDKVAFLSGDKLLVYDINQTKLLLIRMITIITLHTLDGHQMEIRFIQKD